MIATVTSILKNSGGVLKEIIVVDDASIEDVSLWGEWKKIREEMKSSGVTLVIHRMSQRQGVALAKAKGASLHNDDCSKRRKELLFTTSTALRGERSFSSHRQLLTPRFCSSEFSISKRQGR